MPEGVVKRSVLMISIMTSTCRWPRPKKVSPGSTQQRAGEISVMVQDAHHVAATALITQLLLERHRQVRDLKW